jgi:hypothetical protein
MKRDMKAIRAEARKKHPSMTPEEKNALPIGVQEKMKKREKGNKALDGIRGLIDEGFTD